MDGGFSGVGPTGGSNNENTLPPAAKLTQCDEHAIVSISPLLSNRLVGLPFLALSVWAYWNSGRCLMSPMGKPGADASTGRIMGALLLFLIALVFSYIGYMLLRPATLHIDVTNRTYKERIGWQLLCKETEGSCEDFSRVDLKIPSAFGITILLLYWRDKNKPPFALHTGDLEQGQHYRRTVGHILHLPYRDEEGNEVVPSPPPTA